MPGVIVPETLPIDTLPGIGSPVQWDLSAEDLQSEVEE